MMNEEVRRIMTTNPVTVSPNLSLQEVSDLMVANRIQQVPVVQEGKLLGLITSYDLWKHLNNDGQNEVSVEDIMTKNVLKITPKDKVGTAAELFMSKRFKTIPVVNLQNELKGIVTAFDVIRSSLKEEYPRPILYQEAFK